MSLIPLLFTLSPALSAQTLAPETTAFLESHAAADEALREGDLPRAEEHLLECLAIQDDAPAIHYALACRYARDGGTGPALDGLARAVDLGYADRAVAEWDEDLSALRGEPRFEELLDAMTSRAESRPEKNPIVAIRSVREGATWPCALAVDDAGERALVGDGSGVLLLLDLRTGETLRAFPTLGAHVVRIVIRPQGDRAFVLTADTHLHVVSLTTGDEPRAFGPVLELPAKHARVHSASLEVDPRGKRLLVSLREHGASLWSMSGTRIAAWETCRTLSSATAIAWSTDGSLVAHPCGKQVLLRDGVSGVVRGEVELSHPALCIALHPDGRHVATGHKDSYVRVWDTWTNEMTRIFEVRDMFETRRVYHVAFSPCGKYAGEHVEILQAPAGYFATEAVDLDLLEGLVVYRRSIDEERPALSSLAMTLYDPKRVRAAQAGVYLVPLDLGL